MIVNGIEIPKDLLEVIDSNKFVVFVGAGVSMGEPTCLPSFDELVEKIGTGTGKKYNKEEETCEKYLGKLKYDKINVHKTASEILSREKLQHNSLHEYIIDLFKSPKDIKIVTTNYDTMFEQVLAIRGIEGIKIYNSPALPLGNQFNGIIHVHGNVYDPESMILTDEDFGKSYITEGYVSRFLIKLFESYHVLFIGYSYEDVIVKYLTRAITTYGSNKRFILIGEESKEFNLLGIQSICFGKNQYNILNRIVNHLGKVNHRGLLDWQDVIKEFTLAPPKDVSLESEIEYCLYDSNRAFILSKNIHGDNWFYWLEKKGIFDSLFSISSTLTDNNKVWLDWFVEEFLGKNDDLIKRCILKYNNQVSTDLIMQIFKKSDNNQFDIADKNLREYLIMFYDEIKDGLSLYRLMETTYLKGLYDISFIVFKKMFDCKMILKDKLYSSNNEIEYECRFLGLIDFIDIIMKSEGIHLARIYPIEFWIFVKDKINSIYEKYRIVGMANEKYDPLNNFSFSLECKRYYSDVEKVLFILCDSVCQLIGHVEKKNKNFAKEYIIDCLHSESNLLKNLGIKLLRNSSLFSYDRKCKLLLKYIGVYSIEMKEQTFLLIANIFKNLSISIKDKLLDEIDKGSKSLNNKSEEELKIIEYGKFNWCTWFAKCGIKDSKIDEIKSKVLIKYPYFKEREYPELNVYDPAVSWCSDKSPKSEIEIMAMNEEELISLLKNFKEDKFNDITREGLYNTFCNCLKTNFEWGINILCKINNCFEENHPIWSKIISKISEFDYSVEQHMQLLDLLIENNDIVKYNDLSLSWYIEKLLDKEQIKVTSDTVLDEMFNFSMKIYELGEKKIGLSSDLITQSLNYSMGTLLVSWVKLLSMEDDATKQKKYYELFDNLLESKSKYYNQIVVQLAGNVRFFYFKNKEWCKTKILPCLTSKDSIIFSAAWEGIAYYSYRLYKEYAYENQNIYLEAITRLSELCGLGRKILVSQYVLLIVHVIDDPTKMFIPSFYKYAEKKDKINFIHTITNCLDNLTDSEIYKLWKNWLKKYWINRIENIPVPLDDDESEKMLIWCLKLKDLFPESVEVVKKGVKLKKITNRFIYALDKSNIIEKYPSDFAELLMYILESNVEIENIEYNIQTLINNIHNTDKRISHRLKEALLKRHITID